MKRLIILGLLVTQLANSQVLTYDDLYMGLKSSANTVLIDFYSPDNLKNGELYLIGLVTENVINEPDKYDYQNKKPLTFTIVTDSLERKSVLNILEAQGLVDRLYLRVNDTYTNVDSASDSFKENELKILIDLFYQKNNRQSHIFIPIVDKEKAIETLSLISGVFDKDKQKYFLDLVKQ